MSCTIPGGTAGRVDLALAGLVAPAAWMFYRTLPDNPLRQSDLVRFSLGLPGLARELVMVLVTALVGAILGLSIPVASGDHRRPGPACRRPAPARDRVSLSRGRSSSRSRSSRRSRDCWSLRIEGRVSATLIPPSGIACSGCRAGSSASFPRATSPRGRWNFPKSSKRFPGRPSPPIVTGFFSFFNLALLYYYSWKLALCTTLLLAVLLFVTLLLLGGLLALRELDPRDRRVDFRTSPRAFGRDQHAANRRGREPRLLPLGSGATPSGSRWRSGPGDSRAGFISG